MVLKFDDDGSLNFIDKRIRKLANPDLRELLNLIGDEVEAQTRTRIDEEKKAPDGTDWKDWSKAYAGSKHGRKKNHGPHPGALRQSGGHSLLVLSGEMRDDITHEVEGRFDVLIGSTKKYANRQNAQRQFLGLSSSNKEDVEDLTINFLDSRVMA